VDLEKLGIAAETASAPIANIVRIVLIVALFGWTTVARLVRGSVLSVKETDYVRAAVAIGAPGWRIVRHHMLPNVAGPLVVATTLSFGNIVMLESVLSFLGLGVQPPMPSWGNMLTSAQESMQSAPRLAIAPGLLIFACVISINFLGDTLQRRLDPRQIER
jgi:peptide/nickel transport system permease protein